MMTPNIHSKRRKAALVLGTLVILTVGVAAFYGPGRDGQRPELLTAAVTRGDVVQTVEATGTLESVTTVQVGSQVSGIVKALHADFNSPVRKGQVLVELDPSELAAEVEQARAGVTRLQADQERATVAAQDAQIKLNRARELAARQLIPATDLETAESTARSAQAAVGAANAQIVQARASLDQQRVNLAHTVIASPIDGIVISRNVDVGQTVAASMQAPTLFVIAQDLTRMQVTASVDESDIGRIAAGQPVRFHVDAYPDDTFAGTVAQVRLQPIVEQNVVSYATMIDVSNQAMKLKPGMTAQVSIEVARAGDVVRVPGSALRFRPDATLLAAFDVAPGSSAGAAGGSTSGVWVIDHDMLTRVPVTPGVSDGRNTAIVAGSIPPGAQVVTGLAAQKTAPAATTASPLLPFGGQRPRG